MWNRQIIAKWQQLGYWRVVLALGLSLQLHFLVIEKFYLYSPAPETTPQILSATLVMPKEIIAPTPSVVLPKPETQPESALQKLKKQKQTKPLAKPADAVNPAFEEPYVNQQLAEKVPSQEISMAEAMPVPRETENTAESINEEGESQLEQTDEVIQESSKEEVAVLNTNAYHYVSTTFDVFTDKEPALGDSPVGLANIVFEQNPNSAQYHIKSLIQPKGLAALLLPDLLQTSEGNIGDLGLQPKQYLYQFGDKKNKTYHAAFDWEAKQLTLQNAKGEQSHKLVAGTQDLLSFMYQFMFLQPLQTMEMRITNGKKVAVYTYGFEGEEIIDTKIGSLNTIHLQRASGENDKRTDLWLALDYQYVPVKIRETEKDGKVYELIVSSLKTTP